MSHPVTGHRRTYYVLDNPDFINVIALTTEGQIVLIRQWRHGTREIELELPAGLVDPGESPLEAARRELLEETGYAAETWSLIGSVKPNPAYQVNTGWSTLAEGCRKVAEPSLDDGEDIEVVLVDPAEIPGLVRDGTIRHSLVLCSLFWWLDGRGGIDWGRVRGSGSASL
ncbi:MAG: NUDIX hydrolase [Isosphaeraceae bacterium]|nr:NUDIX hydrolase [Isosphaeraceae bacterium]